MLDELQDSTTKIFHDTFQRWRGANPEGKFLTRETLKRATLHGAACHHLGSVDWVAEAGTGRHSLTRRRKVLGQGQGSLAAWAKARGVEVSLCKHCLRDGLVGEQDLVPAEPQSGARPSSAALSGASLGRSEVAEVTEAVEGQLREAMSLQYGRNATLRAMALARADGVCEGCNVNFKMLAGGLGLSALQVHHKVALGQRSGPSITKVEELAVLCANCHCMVHAYRDKVLTVEELRHKHGAG
jgi:hypothetical protein